VPLANIEKHNETIKQIQRSDVTTGFGADLIKNINRVRAQILNDEKAGKQVSATEKLEAMLGSQVFTLLTHLGCRGSREWILRQKKISWLLC
jgi:hypothetical protein